MIIREADRSCYAAEAQAFFWTKRPLITIDAAKRIIAKQCEFLNIPQPSRVTHRRATHYANLWGGGFYDHVAKRIHLKPAPSRLVFSANDMLQGKEWDGKTALIPLYTVLHECAHHACDMLLFGRGHTCEFRAMVQHIANTWGYAYKLQRRASKIKGAWPNLESMLEERRLNREPVS